MADFALFIGYGEIVPGREQAASRVFGETMEYFGRLQQEGAIVGVEPFFLEPHGGDLGGFFLVRGEKEALAKVRASEEFDRIVLRATMVVQRVGVVSATTGAELNRQLGEFDRQTAGSPQGCPAASRGFRDRLRSPRRAGDPGSGAGTPATRSRRVLNWERTCSRTYRVSPHDR